ncbi:hypothetical protein [Xanthomarina spongicola]|nr:hypothetical protein [Xanthomarina spongicola]
METLVATVLIIIVFIITSMILNNLFSGSIKNNTQAIDTYLKELQYLQFHDKIDLPYSEDYNHWEISIEKYDNNKFQQIEIEALNKQTNKTITKKYIEQIQ